MQIRSANMPKVSICIPTYKQVEYLRRTLQSVSEQTFEDYEVIVSDDSPDGSVENLLKEFNFQKKLRYHKNSPAQGTPENWNKVISMAVGKYIKILHHDDYFTFSYSLHRFVDLLDRNPEVNFAFSATMIWNLAKEKKILYKAPTSILKRLKIEPELLFQNNWVGAPSTTIYRSEMQISYDNKMKWLVDVDFYIRAIKKSKNFAYSSLPLITTPKGVEHQVTEACKDNKEVELYEAFRLFHKLFVNKHDSRKLLIPLAKLFIKYNIESFSDLEKLGIVEDRDLVQQIFTVSKNFINRATFKLEKIKNLLLQLDF
jgi:glycosyltransferase involved in cell wall biosynthesis